MNQTIDLRSDTVTRPTPGMLKAMHNAEVGDDVFGEDPTVNKLEAKAAEMFGVEAGLFCPSGTMTNQIAVKTHTEALTEVIIHELSHIYVYEAGGMMFNSGVSVKLVRNNRGKIFPQDIANRVSPENVHFPRTKLVCVENTVNKAGGVVYHIDEIREIRKACGKNGLKLHMDGARLFNAIVANHERPEDYGTAVDSISICLSKGLGAPVGSLLLGNKDFIHEARRFRKVFGGGMRQAGYLAAAGIYALDHHVNRLEEDHLKAKAIERELLQKEFIKEVIPVESNIVIFKTETEAEGTLFLEKMKAKNILGIPMGEGFFRFVTHLDFTDEMLIHFKKAIKEVDLS
ncbi:MAG: GntG family PLP-dependent aldolase [Chitinophagales bacterium]